MCYYNKNLPSQLLKPVKVEMLNLDPDLNLFHDIITDSEIEHVKKLAKPQVSVFNSTQLLSVMIDCSASSADLDFVALGGLLFLLRGPSLEGCTHLKSGARGGSA